MFMKTTLKYMLPVAIAAITVFAGTRTAPRHIPSDLRDAVADNAGAADFNGLQNLKAYSVKAVPAVPVPAAAAPAPQRWLQPSHKQAIERAKELLDNSLQDQGQYNKTAFWQDVKSLRAAFDNRFVIKNKNCGKDVTLMYTLKSDYYEHGPSSGEKNVVYVCNGYHPTLEMEAQDLIHETSHLALIYHENQATEMEIVVTALGGGYPLINGYMNFDSGLSQDDLAALGWEYLKLLGINSKISWEYQLLRERIAYGDYDVFAKQMETLRPVSRDLFAYVDIKGFKLADLVCQPERERYAAYLAANFPDYFKACKQATRAPAFSVSPY